jgi:ferric-dicitrate binding protein FerR (iron transport regulator)
MKDPIINDILYKAVSGEALNPQEQALFDEWLAADEANRAMYANWKDETYFRQKLMEVHQIDISEAKRKIDEKIAANGSIIPMRRNLIQYAAAAVLIIAVASYFWINKSRPAATPQADINTIVHQNDVAPGQNKAVLTLSNGRRIALDSNSINNLDEQGHLIKNKNGQLVYQKGSQHANEVLYNTLTTARGETYSIVLSDGSTITLNSASSIRYPIVFANDERKIEVTGEAFFDVTHDATHPFVAQVNGMEIKVLGTVFNVNSYREENKTTTTLLEGKVQLSKDKNTKMLMPGEQGELLPSGAIQVKKGADIDKAVGWKKGLFVFKGDDVKSVMNQLSRWYDVNVVYKGTISDKFTGIIDRSLPVAVVLDMLQQSTVHFKIEGRTITVTP